MSEFNPMLVWRGMLTCDSYLSLLCVMGKGSSNDKRLLIDYNVGILHDALLQVFKV